MPIDDAKRPRFIIIGAQKCGTTWLWEMLKQHPETDLRVSKDIHFFSLSRVYSKGLDWYFGRFSHLDSSKVIGDVSASYFCDYVQIDNLENDYSLPVVPELITTALPNVKIIVILRDPVSRAISAYYHHMRRRQYSPFLDLRKADLKHPNLRIVQRGHYERFMKVWKSYIPTARMRILIFEEDVLLSPDQAIKETYDFLNLDPEFKPEGLDKPKNKGWRWTHILLNYYSGGIYGNLLKLFNETHLSSIFNIFDVFPKRKLKREDIDCLRSIYLAGKGNLETLLDRSLDCWDYGLSIKTDEK